MKCANRIFRIPTIGGLPCLDLELIHSSGPRTFPKNDLWIIPKAKELGFEALDIAVMHPEVFSD